MLNKNISFVFLTILFFFSITVIYVPAVFSSEGGHQSSTYNSISVSLVGNSSYNVYHIDEEVDISLIVNATDMSEPKALYLWFESDNPEYAECNATYLTIYGCSHTHSPLINELFPLSMINLPCGDSPCLFSFPASSLGAGNYKLQVMLGDLIEIQNSSNILSFGIEGVSGHSEAYPCSTGICE